jgi:hypothetical protein
MPLNKPRANGPDATSPGNTASVNINSSLGCHGLGVS